MNNNLMIEANKLSKRFDKLVAVDQLNLRVSKGDIHGFVGPNGAGKSTTMKMLIGAIKSTGGECLINSSPMGSMEARKSLGFSPERPFFYSDMTAWDYLVYMGALSGMKVDAAEKRARDLLIWLELDNFRNKKVGGFSAGMKQRLCLAQAMTHEPQLLILDEPTANMDPDGRMSFMDKLKELRDQKGITIFISSHILLELEQIIDAVTIINKGRTVAEDRICNMKNDATINRYILKTSDNKAVLKALQGEPCIQAIAVDAEGVIHLTSSQPQLLQNRVVEIISRTGAFMEIFGKEYVNLQDIYRKTMGKG